MTRLVRALEEDGLAEREVDAGDRRVHRVRATQEGVRLLAAGRDRRVSDLEARLTRLAPDELRVLDQAASLLQELLTPPP